MSVDQETIYVGPPDEWPEVDAVMSNLDGYVRGDAEALLRDRPVYGCHAGWEFNGLVWFQDGRFHEQVWRHHVLQATYSADTLDDLFRTVNDEWGWA